ncbi:MAG: ExbD/TolR family protein, partial [Spirochaetota bacterium]
TTSEPPQGVDVEMPKAVTEGAEQDTIYISVSSDGTVYVEGEKSSLEGLNDFLAMHGAERDKTVSVTADRNLPYKTVREVLETLRSRDFLNVIFMAQPEE